MIILEGVAVDQPVCRFRVDVDQARRPIFSRTLQSPTAKIRRQIYQLRPIPSQAAEGRKDP